MIDENEDRWHDLFLTSEEDNEIAVTTSIQQVVFSSIL
jgi:hypothetical protein